MTDHSANQMPRILGRQMAQKTMTITEIELVYGGYDDGDTSQGFYGKTLCKYAPSYSPGGPSGRSIEPDDCA